MYEKDLKGLSILKKHFNLVIEGKREFFRFENASRNADAISTLIFIDLLLKYIYNLDV